MPRKPEKDRPSEATPDLARDALASLFELAVNEANFTVDVPDFEARVDYHFGKLKGQARWRRYRANDTDERFATRKCMLRGARVAVAAALNEDPSANTIYERHMQIAEDAIHKVLRRLANLKSAKTGRRRKPIKAKGLAC